MPPNKPTIHPDDHHGQPTVSVPDLTLAEESAALGCEAVHCGSWGCAAGYCLCPPGRYGHACASIFTGSEPAGGGGGDGGEFDSEYDYLRAQPFQIKQRLAASFVAGSDFVLEVAGGRAGIGRFLQRQSFGPASAPSRKLYHNVEPVAGGSYQYYPSATDRDNQTDRDTPSANGRGGWVLAQIPLLLQDYRLPARARSSSIRRSLVLLGFTPPSADYCHTLLRLLSDRDESTGGFEDNP